MGREKVKKIWTGYPAAVAGCLMLSAALVCGACGERQQEEAETGKEVAGSEAPEGAGEAGGEDGKGSEPTGTDGNWPEPTKAEGVSGQDGKQAEGAEGKEAGTVGEGSADGNETAGGKDEKKPGEAEEAGAVVKDGKKPGTAGEGSADGNETAGGKDEKKPGEAEEAGAVVKDGKKPGTAGEGSADGNKTAGGEGEKKPGEAEADRAGVKDGKGAGTAGEKDAGGDKDPSAAVGKDPVRIKDNVPDGEVGKQPETAGSEDKAEQLPFNTDKLWGLENLEKYVTLDEIGEYAISCLNWMTIWCRQEHEGSFILDGYNEKEDAVVRQIYEATGKTACWILQRDFDGDGREEAFAYVCGLDSDGGIEVWFAAADGSVQMLMEDNTYSGQCSLGLPGNTFYLCGISGADNESYYMYEVDGNVAKPAALEVGNGVGLLEDGRLTVWSKSYDVFSSAADYRELVSVGSFDYTYKEYYYSYDEGGFHEYSGVPVTEEELCQYENGYEILCAVQKGDGIVTDIYYFADGRMVVNYVEKAERTDESSGSRMRRNYYLQVPVVSEGEEGFCLGWDASLDIQSMQEALGAGGSRNEYDIILRAGVYAPVYQEELAQYPDHQPPVEYYKEKYAALVKEDLKICALKTLAGFEEPKRVLATGADLAGISRRNLIFTFSDAFRDAVRAKTEQAGTAVAEGAGALLGLGAYEKSIGIWIGDECVCKGSLQNVLCGETVGFAAGEADHDGEPSVYAGKLVYADNARARESVYFTAAAAVKLHAFAEVTGLASGEELVRIRKPGAYRAEQEYMVDLDGDGVEESLFYGGNLLLVDGKNYSAFLDGDEDNNFFFLWDIDTSDNSLEIGLWRHGDSCSEFTDIYWYNGECLKRTGTLEGPRDKGYREIAFDGSGTVRADGRLSVLQTWSAPMSFCLNMEHELTQVEQELYYPKLGGGEDYPYTLRAPVRLYEDMDTASDSVVILPGRKLVFPATDNKSFVMVETEDGLQGYLYLEEGRNIENPEGGYYEWTEDVVGGLNFAG